MKSVARAGLALFLGTLSSMPGGCVGPNHLKRTLDAHLNESYVRNPLLSELLLPVNLVANHIAALTDLLVVNPTYWWRDALRGEGTPHIYRQPSAVDSEESGGVE